MEIKPLRVLLIILLGGALTLAGFAGGIFTGYQLPRNVALLEGLNFFKPEETPLAPLTSPTETLPVDQDTLFEPFWQAWDLVHEQYVDQPVDDETLMRGAISGMLSSLGDDYTGYLDPMQYDQATAPLEGEYDGIGAWVDTSGEFLTIISPMEGSPAEEVGLQSGDFIIAVDGISAVGTDPSLVLRNVLGEAGTPVVLTIQREGVEEPFDVTIIRQKITISLVSSRILDNNIAYLQIQQFGDDTEQEVKDALRKLLAEKPIGLILDLRNDPGGYLDTAIGIVSQFIPDGVVMYEVHGNGEKITFTARRGGLATEIPLIVLVNEGSASASEITAGAIQDRERGILVGTTTFGKGTVQIWNPLKNDAGAVKITIARWLTPNERQISKIGLTPDFVVEMTEEDYAAGRDPQLDKAVELMLAGAAD